ncbi:hypothetical protein E1176_16080 [Fulvivirga sp. RKSG066]|uniref:hypothetical protein n=1 Tax=Fulvivirga aurantia TaxID=2529383 RepID=UPI0012BD2B2E|nr:hypothetical protein [Fulvivirga aurantia]MTI22551.1 hypothetical protein [Fulvivirga aurantia]
MKLPYTLGLMLVLIMSVAHSQEKKIERESRVKLKETPKDMQSVLMPFVSEAKKLKYYQEYDGKRITYEAKVILHKRHFSIEFSEEGKLEDVEVIYCFTELPQDTQDAIVDYLMQYANFKIKKTQKQFTDINKSDSGVIQGAIENDNTLTIKYELVISIKESVHWASFELLFDRNGKLLEKKEMANRSEDHLLY